MSETYWRADTDATGWVANAERTDARLQPVTEWLIDKAEVGADDVVLEVAAGPGGVGHRVAPLVVNGGSVLSTDLSPAMVDAARRIGRQRSASNVAYCVMDAQEMSLERDSFDAVISRSGYMLMPSPVSALRESARVLRPGRNLAFSVFAGPAHNPFVAVPQRVFVDLGHLEPPAPGTPGVFALSEPDRIDDVVSQAGLQVLGIEAIDLEGSFPTAVSIVDRILEMNVLVAPVHRRLPEDEQMQVRGALIDAFGRYAEADGSYVLPSRMWGVQAR